MSTKVELVHHLHYLLSKVGSNLIVTGLGLSFRERLKMYDLKYVIEGTISNLQMTHVIICPDLQFVSSVLWQIRQIFHDDGPHLLNGLRVIQLSNVSDYATRLTSNKHSLGMISNSAILFLFHHMFIWLRGNQHPYIPSLCCICSEGYLLAQPMRTQIDSAIHPHPHHHMSENGTQHQAQLLVYT